MIALSARRPRQQEGAVTPADKFALYRAQFRATGRLALSRENAEALFAAAARGAELAADATDLRQTSLPLPVTKRRKTELVEIIAVR
jgi:hypothetical protein